MPTIRTKAADQDLENQPSPPMDHLLASLRDTEVEDPEEETYLLFSQQKPANPQNLGFVDPKAKTLDLQLLGKDVSIRQSPGLLNSNREGGTTGAVLWKITPLFASWIAQSNSSLARAGVLNKDSDVLELGCGISGLISLALASKIATYVNTDQEYTLKLVRENVEENYETFAPKISKPNKKAARSKAAKEAGDRLGNIITKELDWETTDIPSFCRDIGVACFDVLISCDCIYNEALVEPLATTMRDLCQSNPERDKPTVVVVAQQLRSPDVMEAWMTTFCKYFRVWRMPDEEFREGDGLGEGSGFCVHIGMLKDVMTQGE